MKYVIYMDVFFAVNFFMDLLILVIAQKFIRPQTTVKRCIAAAVAGTTLSCIILVSGTEHVIIQKIFTYVIIPSVMAVTAYPVKNAKACIRAVAVLYGVTVVLAGAVNGLYYFTGAGYFLKRGINIIHFIFITAAAYFITLFLTKYIKTRAVARGKSSDIYDVILTFQGRQVRLKGLYDSGNSLMEPIAHTPVHIAQYDGIKELLEGVEAAQTKMRIVPYKALGTQMGVLHAVEFDSVQIEIDGEYIYIDKAMIGIYRGSLSQTGNYQMILNRSIKKWL